MKEYTYDNIFFIKLLMPSILLKMCRIEIARVWEHDAEEIILVLGKAGSLGIGKLNTEEKTGGM